MGYDISINTGYYWRFGGDDGVTKKLAKECSKYCEVLVEELPSYFGGNTYMIGIDFDDTHEDINFDDDDELEYITNEFAHPTIERLPIIHDRLEEEYEWLCMRLAPIFDKYGLNIRNYREKYGFWVIGTYS